MNAQFGHIRNLHFVGIGGAGMSGIAQVCLELGYQVTGSDLQSSTSTQALEQKGAKVHIGHRRDNVEHAQVVIHSTAVQADNEELVEATAQHIPVIHRSEMLAELMRLKSGIAVAGAHGKTTTTSLIASIFESAGLDPTVVIGGQVKGLGSHGKLGQSEWLIAEADESDGSFLYLSPIFSVINNYDLEHLDYWGDGQRLEQAYVDFANRTPFYGLVALGQDDDQLARIRSKIRRPVRTYGIDAAADLEGRITAIEPEHTVFEVRDAGHVLGTVRLPMSGRHNVRNALAAIVISQAAGIGFDQIRKGLESFEGIRRRFEILRQDVPVVIDDYGHHPREIEVTIATAKQRWDAPLMVVFQPHRYSRTEHLWDHFQTAFHAADHVRVLPIYAAGEKAIEGIDHIGLAAAMHDAGHPDAKAIDADDIPTAIQSDIGVVLFMGAGNITKWAHDYAN